MNESQSPLNEQQIQELNKLQKSIEDLSHQTDDIKDMLDKEPGNVNSVQFLLAEFDWLGSIWQQTDSRLADTIRLYVAAAALLPTALLFLGQRLNNSRDIIMLSLPIALGLSVTRVLCTFAQKCAIATDLAGLSTAHQTAI